MNAGKPKILLFVDWYEPGYKAGGPIRSCVNFARHMRDAYRVYIFTSDRDLGSIAPYEHIRTDEWTGGEGDISIYYCSPANLGWRTIHRQMRQIAPDFVYLNSMFSPRFSIYPLLIDTLHGLKNRIVLSPRGMLKSSAIRFKPARKKLFIAGIRGLGIHRKITFLASDETERTDIRQYFGPRVRVDLISNFPAALPEPSPITEKARGELSMIFVGRIHPIKNLDYLLTVLREVKGKIQLTIVGSREEEAFWSACQVLIRDLPPGATATYMGAIPNDELAAVIARHHIFVLPTKGENFGHAIFEALALGKPVLISDQTPWKGLAAAGAGWDLPLDRPETFRQALEEAVAFDQQEYTGRCGQTRKFVEAYMRNSDLKEKYQKLFS